VRPRTPARPIVTERNSRRWYRHRAGTVEMSSESQFEADSSVLAYPPIADPYPHFTWPAKMLVRNMDF
jgi:hypothetical protein